jgi:hypothetical protein
MLAAKWIRKSSVGLLSLGLLVSVSGCWTAPDRQTSAEYGALQGAAIGGIFGCSAAYNYSSAHHMGTAFAIGCPVGVAAGAVIGGVAGYALYGPPPEKWVPPAKPKPATSSVSPNPANEQALATKADSAKQLSGPQQALTERRVTDLSTL